MDVETDRQLAEAEGIDMAAPMQEEEAVTGEQAFSEPGAKRPG